MRLPWVRRPRCEQRRTDADHALEISRQQHHHAAARRREFTQLAGLFRRTREENHLAEKFNEAFGGGH